MRRHPDFSRPIANHGFVHWFMVVMAAFIPSMLLVMLFTLFLLSGAPARDNGQWETGDPMIRAWYRALMQPDNKTVSCCGFADAYYADKVETGPNGELIAVITDTRDDKPLGRPHVPVGTKIIVPRNKIKFDAGNPVGRNIIFLSAERNVYCFVQAKSYF